MTSPMSPMSLAAPHPELPPAVFEGACGSFLSKRGSLLEFYLNATQVTMVAALRPTSLPINKAIFAHDALQIASWNLRVFLLDFLSFLVGKRGETFQISFSWDGSNTINH